MWGAGQRSQGAYVVMLLYLSTEKWPLSEEGNWGVKKIRSEGERVRGVNGEI